MKKRSGAGGELTRRRKTPEPKRRNAPKAAARSNSPPTGKVEEFAQLARELGEAIERQTATTEVLQVINSSYGDLQPVFQTMLAKAVRLCQATFGVLWLAEGDRFRSVALHNLPPAFAAARQRDPVVYFGPKSGTGRLIEKKQIFQIEDLTKDPGYIERDPRIIPLVELGGARTALFAPLLQKNHVIGSIVLYRQEVCPFGDKQIALVTNFAAQAVIAIENARLLNELRQRTDDLTERTAQLTEALEQQTATSEVLQAISGSPGDLQPVFATMLENMVRVCHASFGAIHRCHGDVFQFVAEHNSPPAYANLIRHSPFRPGPQHYFGPMMASKSVEQFADLAASQGYLDRRPEFVSAVELGGVRTGLNVPMLNENELIGVFALARDEVHPFTDEQIELVENFAAQAVIAIENARLLNELRQRTTDLTEALEQQRATSGLLQVISGSPGNLEPVFQTMLENAVGICGANFGNMFLYEDEAFRTVAMFNAPEAYANARMGARLHPPSDSGLGRLVSTKEVVQIADLRTVERYVINRDPFVVAAVELGGIRTLLAVPMLKEGRLVGAIVIYRQEVRPFTEKQIELVKNFGSQVVIAIENARLLNELRQRTTDLSEALEQQTATSDVLQVISSSPGDLEPVFATMLEKAVRICDASFGNIYRWDGEALHLLATQNTPPAFAEALRSSPSRPHPKNVIGRMLTTKKITHIADAKASEAYAERHPATVAAVELGGIRSVLTVPLLKENKLIGAFALARQEVRPFTDKQIALVANFAAQAVIAIENARLLRELRERTDQSEAQSQELANLNQQLEQRVTDQVDEIERMSRLRRFLPPQVADLIVASGSEKQLESHRREITALFCDLRGFTGFTESADAEDVMALLRDYHAAIGEIIIKYNGTLERYAGDGVMVVFNDPVPVENPALQAVLMALELRDALGALTATWSRLGHEIGFGIGIAHGFATLGTIGFEGRFDYAAIGTVSNVASRLCDEAKPGQILISPRVLMKVENSVKVEPVGEFELKGIRRPLAAYDVVAAVGSSD
jgi:GAF domain-containing protein